MFRLRLAPPLNMTCFGNTVEMFASSLHSSCHAWKIRTAGGQNENRLYNVIPSVVEGSLPYF